MDFPKIAVVFNGPPRCGKDTLAKMIWKWLSGPVRQDCFKMVLYDETYKRVLPEFQEFVPPEYWGSAEYDETKDDPDLRLVMTDGFEGTVRECLIHVSEDIIKPQHGDDFFGKALAEKLQPGYNLITDGGFDHELFPITDAADIVIVLRMRRAGFDFTNDSRNYIDDRYVRATFWDIPIRSDHGPEDSAALLGKLFVEWEQGQCRAGTPVTAMVQRIPASFMETFG